MRVFRYLLEHKSALGLIIVLLLVQAFCDLALPTLTAGIVDVGIRQFGIENPTEAQEELITRAIATQDYSILGFDPWATQLSYLVRIGALMLGITLIGGLVAVAVSYLASRTSASIGRDLRERLFERVVSFSDAEIQRFSAASLITRATNDITQIQMVSFVAMRMVLFAPIMAIGGIVMVIRTDVSMAWVIVLAVVLVLTLILAVMAIAMPKFKIMQTLIDKVNLVARESLTGLQVIRAFNRESYEEQRFDDANSNLMKTQLFTNRVMAFMHPGVQLALNGTTALIVWVGSGLIDAGTLETGQMIAFITYATVIIMSFMMISMIAILLPRANVAAHRIDEVLNCTSSISDPVHPRDNELASTQGASIEFDHVTFAYDSSSEPVLNDVSFAIPAGSTFAIVGSTGSGKSTILKLVMRLYDTTKGSVRIDGIDVRDLSLHTLHKQFGYVPQKSFLFSGSIESNIAYSDQNMPQEQIQEAARIAQAEDFILAKDNTYDFEVSQGGTNVSGGQRQRLAIARALATNARVFLFDDSFSALDYATDAALRKALDKDLSGKTRIIVAQRISTVRDADCIIVIDGGKMVGQGSHKELLDTCEVYREIAASQLSEDELGGSDVA